MFRLVIFASLFVTAHCFSSESEKYWAMWTNIETAPNSTKDGQVTIYEIQSYFNNSYSDANSIINFYTFDYVWGTRYNDSTAVTQYIFVTWDDATRDNVLNPTDLVAMYTTINTWTSSTPDYIDYAAEFFPYFQSLYAGCCTLPW